MKRLKKAIVLTLIFFSVSIFGITFLPNYVQADDENTDVRGQDEEYENYSKDYKKYLALSDEAKANYIAIPHKYDVTMNEYTTTKEIFDRKNHGLMKSAQSLLTANLASSFDLRSKINIRVENQNPYGLCWDYATMGTLRTYTALRGISKANDGYTNDFSEWHINVLTSRLYPSKGYNRYTGDGGNFCDCEKYFRYNDGPVWEERYPFGSSIPSDSAGLKALDDMTPNIYVHQTIDFPSVDKRKESGVTKMYVEGKEISASEMKEIRDQVKSHIVTNGGVYCSIRTNDNFIGNNLGAPYNTYSGKYSQYDDGSIAGENCGGHAVTIIGWDDNYNRMNFYAKNKNGEIVHPTSNGAWLILNSYGPDAFEAGCQWVSYEDAKVEADLHGILKADKVAQKVKYTLKNKNVYSVLKKAFETEGADMTANDSAMTIEVYDIAIDGITSLNFSECEMTDEDAREVFKNPFPKLKYLNLNYNKLTTIEPILVNTNLINLDVDCNAQTQLDVTGISALKNIRWLNLNSNKSLKSYAEVFKLLKLRNLFLYNDNIASISGVKNLTDLESLVLGKNSIVDVSEIGNLKNLVRLELNSNKIEDISKLTPKQYSTKFTIDGQKITKTISNTISSYSYPDIIKKAKLSSSEVYSSDGLEFTNCSENSAGNGIVLNNGKGIAKVKVKSGLANNTTLTLVPILSTITVISPDAGTYKAGEEILITATYNEDVYKLSDSSLVTLDAQSAPVLKIKFGNGSEKNTIFRSATSNASSKTTVIVYSYKIVSGDNGEISISSYTGTVYGTDKTGYSVQKLENTGKKIVADTVAPQLQTINVTSPAKGVYAKGQTITLVATFDENVYGTNNKGSIAASNAPVMKIKFGTGSEKQATFDSANGSKIIYKYTIANNDNGKLTTSSYTGNVFDAVGNSRTVANVTIGGNEIYSDTSIPQLQSINVTSPESGTYKAGQTITMVATFSEKLYGTNNKGAITASNAPVLKIKFGTGSEKQATFASAGEKTITYTYKVVTGDTGKLASTNYTGKVYSEMGQECNVQKMDLGGNTIYVDTSYPHVQNINIISPVNGKYKAGQKIDIEVQFHEYVYGTNNKGAVTTSNAPVLKLKVGESTTEKTATFKSVNENKITYTYTITNGDNGKLAISSYTGNIYDKFGNVGEVTKVDIGENDVVADTIKPEVEIKANVTSPTSVSTIKYTFTFSEDVIGFTKEDVTVENGTAGELQGSGKVYTIVVTNQGVCRQRVSISAGKCTDKAGNENVESNVCEIVIKNGDEPDSEKVQVLLGDINENGKIELNDVIALIRHMAVDGKAGGKDSWKLNSRKKLIADTTQDGKINLSDIIKLKRYMAVMSDSSLKNKKPQWKELGKIILDKVK